MRVAIDERGKLAIVQDKSNGRVLFKRGERREDFHKSSFSILLHLLLLPLCTIEKHFIIAAPLPLLARVVVLL